MRMFVFLNADALNLEPDALISLKPDALETDALETDALTPKPSAAITAP